MLTLRDILEQRRQQLLEFFSWRFGTPHWTQALIFCSGLSNVVVASFRNKPVAPGTILGKESRKFLSSRDLMRIETAALHLGFKPGRIVSANGKFTRPPSLALPRWSHSGARVRYREWLAHVKRNKLLVERSEKRVAKKAQCEQKDTLPANPVEANV